MINETQSSVSPLGSGGEAFAYQYKTYMAFYVSKDEWLVINYDDIFGNHFKTECQWSGEVWHNFKTERVIR